MSIKLPIPIPRERLAAICHKWHIRELSLFGSITRGDFGPDSDVDVLVTFDPQAKLDWNIYVDLVDELEAIFDRPVDLVIEKNISNPYRRAWILREKTVLYAA